jgi:hypothetical protein
MDHKNSEKSLRWLANQFPLADHPKDDAEKLSTCIHLYCENGANSIAALLKEADRREDSLLQCRGKLAEKDRINREDKQYYRMTLAEAVRDLLTVCYRPDAATRQRISEKWRDFKDARE